jgi:hypothetical protein
MYAHAALILPRVLMGYSLFTGSANVARPYFSSPSSGSASRRRWIFFRISPRVSGGTGASRRRCPRTKLVSPQQTWPVSFYP